MPVATLTPSPSAAPAHLCQTCGRSDRDGTAPSFVYRRGISFCLVCWESLPNAALQQMVQTVALRGGPS
jgi:hypothetical protein